MNRQPRPRPFRSVTVNIGTRRNRTVIITMCLSVAAMLIFISVIAVQLMTATGKDSFATRVLHSLSNQSLNLIMSQEIPLYASADPRQIGKLQQPGASLTSMLFYLLTDIDVERPETMLNKQISAMAVSHIVPLTEDSTEKPGDDIPPANPPAPDASAPKPEEPIKSDGKPKVYVYQSHNRESYLPELKGVTDFDKAYDKEKNVTLVGERLVQSLKEKNIETLQTKTDYWTMGSFEKAYDFSRNTIKEVLSKNTRIQMVFDVHRDSLPRESTTAQWNGQNVAKVSFIIGGSNPNSQKNEEFAKKLHNQMKKMYPGVSKGAFKKTNTRFDTRYNQDLFPNSILIEIGGPENSLEEANRTADLLANVIAELMKEQQK